MKKTILAVVLPIIIYGCSDNEASATTDTTTTENLAVVETIANEDIAIVDEVIQNTQNVAEKFASFEKNYLTATNTVIDYASKFSTGTMKYNAAVSLDDEKTTIQDTLSYIDNQNGLIVQYDIETTGEVDLSKYNHTDGHATIKGTSTGSLSLDFAKASESLVFQDIFSGAAYQGTLNEKNKTFSYASTIDQNVAPLILSGQQIAEVTLKGFNNNLALKFNNDYTQLESMKSSAEGKELLVAITGELSKEVEASAVIKKLVTSSSYHTQPFEAQSIASIGNVSVDFKSAAEYGNISFDNLEVKSHIADKNGLISGKVGYNIGNLYITQNKLPTIDFGSLTLLAKIEGIQNIEDWQSLLDTANKLAAQDTTQISEVEAKAFLQSLASIFTKDTRVETVLENKLTIGDAVKLTLSFQPTEKLINLIQAGPDTLTDTAISTNPVELINDYVKEFAFKGTITDGYMIAQYEKALKLQGQDASQAKNEVNGVVQMMMMVIAMQTSQLGVSPLQYEAGTLFADIHFKDGVWNINGTKLTTEEIFSAFQ